MAWGHVVGALGLALGAGVVTIFSNREKERQEAENEEHTLAEKRVYDARMLAEKRVYDEGQKAKALVEKYASARSYWQSKVGDEEFYIFSPAGVPGDDPITAEVIEVLDTGLRVEDENGVHHFISFEGTTFAVPKEPEEESPSVPPIP